MTYRKVPLAHSEFYHIYNRGNSKQTICHDEADFIRFQQLLYLCNNDLPISHKDACKRKGGVYSVEKENPLVAIGAYCLLSNHFHLLLTPIAEEGISKFMQKLSTAYVMYFNKKFERSGALFEGPFRSKHADSDRYLKYLFSYIHLNSLPKVPRRGLGTEGANSALELAIRYKFSSLSDYCGVKREAGFILDTKKFPDYFNSYESISDELLTWITYDENEEVE